MPKRTIRRNPGSWAAKYAAQRQETNERLYGAYDPVLDQNQADILRESRRADYHLQQLEAERKAAEEERKRYLEDPDGYLSANHETHSRTKQDIEDLYKTKEDPSERNKRTDFIQDWLKETFNIGEGRGIFSDNSDEYKKSVENQKQRIQEIQKSI